MIEKDSLKPDARETDPEYLRHLEDYKRA